MEYFLGTLNTNLVLLCWRGGRHLYGNSHQNNLRGSQKKNTLFFGGDFGGNYPFNNVSFLYHPSLICENHVMAVFNRRGSNPLPSAACQINCAAN